MGHFAEGSTITYNGPFPGATVVYGPVLNAFDQGVSESSVTDPVPLFGPPSVTGDSIDFNPTGFGAFGAGGGGDVTDGQLVFKVQAKPNFGINNITFGEAGITTLAGVGTNLTHTDVSAVGNIDIYEVDGVLINKISIPLNLVFTPLTATGNQGTFQLVADAGLGLSFAGLVGKPDDQFEASSYQRGHILYTRCDIDRSRPRQYSNRPV